MSRTSGGTARHGNYPGSLHVPLDVRTITDIAAASAAEARKSGQRGCGVCMQGRAHRYAQGGVPATPLTVTAG